MSYALQLSSGRLAQLSGTGDTLNINAIEAFGPGADVTIVIRAKGDGEVQIGEIGKITRIIGDLNVDGAEIVVGTTTFEGDIDLGDDSGDEITLAGFMTIPVTSPGIVFTRSAATDVNKLVLPRDGAAGTEVEGSVRVNSSGELQWYFGSSWQTAGTATPPTLSAVYDQGGNSVTATVDNGPIAVTSDEDMSLLTLEQTAVFDRKAVLKITNAWAGDTEDTSFSLELVGVERSVGTYDGSIKIGSLATGGTDCEILMGAIGVGGGAANLTASLQTVLLDGSGEALSQITAYIADVANTADSVVSIVAGHANAIAARAAVVIDADTDIEIACDDTHPGSVSLATKGTAARTVGIGKNDVTTSVSIEGKVINIDSSDIAPGLGYGQIYIGTGNDVAEHIQIGNINEDTVTVIYGGGAVGEIDSFLAFGDRYLYLASGWSDKYLRLSDATTEWDTLETNLGSDHSLVYYLNALFGGGALTLQNAYDNGASIVCDASGPVSITNPTGGSPIDQAAVQIVQAHTTATKAALEVSNAASDNLSIELTGAGRRGIGTRDKDLYTYVGATTGSGDRNNLVVALSDSPHTGEIAATLTAQKNTGTTAGNATTNVSAIVDSATCSGNASSYMRAHQEGTGNAVIIIVSETVGKDTPGYAITTVKSLITDSDENTASSSLWLQAINYGYGTGATATATLSSSVLVAGGSSPTAASNVFVQAFNEGSGAGNVNVEAKSRINIGCATAVGLSGDVYIGADAAASEKRDIVIGTIASGKETTVDVRGGIINIGRGAAESHIEIGNTTAGTYVHITAADDDDIVLAARTYSLTFNDAVDTDLDSRFAATSIIGAFNEIMSGVAGGIPWEATANETIGAALAVGTASGADFRVQRSDANGTVKHVIGISQSSAASAGDTLWVQSFGLAAVTCASGESWTRGVAVYMSTVVGEVTITAPTASGDVVQRVGWAAETNSTGTSRKMFIAIGEPVTL